MCRFDAHSLPVRSCFRHASTRGSVPDRRILGCATRIARGNLGRSGGNPNGPILLATNRLYPLDPVEMGWPSKNSLRTYVNVSGLPREAFAREFNPAPALTSCSLRYSATTSQMNNVPWLVEYPGRRVLCRDLHDRNPMVMIRLFAAALETPRSVAGGGGRWDNERG
jgi:hypothetical protein